MELYQRLEVEWAKFNDLDPRGMVACSSGTAALHLALECLELPPGSEVIVPDYTMVACPRAVTLAGLRPRFVDCGPDLLMDDGDPMGNAQVEPYSAFMAVHVYGRRVDMDWIFSTAGVCHAVVEDLAEAHGLKPHPATDAACWSFYKNKVVAGEEGGAVWFRDYDRAEAARSLRTLGFTEAHDYTHRPRGHNYRMSNLHAEPILDSIYFYEENLEARRGLEQVCDGECPDRWRMPPREVPWVYDLRVPGLTTGRQAAAVGALREAGIPARFGFKPCSSQEEYRNPDGPTNPNAYAAAREVIYLPLQPGVMTEALARTAFRLLRGLLPDLT